MFIAECSSSTQTVCLFRKSIVQKICYFRMIWYSFAKKIFRDDNIVLVFSEILAYFMRNHFALSVVRSAKMIIFFPLQSEIKFSIFLPWSTFYFGSERYIFCVFVCIVVLSFFRNPVLMAYKVIVPYEDYLLHIWFVQRIFKEIWESSAQSCSWQLAILPNGILNIGWFCHLNIDNHKCGKMVDGFFGKKYGEVFRKKDETFIIPGIGDYIINYCV